MQHQGSLDTHAAHAPRRRYVFARFGDTFATVAERELPDGDATTLASWNLHLVARRGAAGQGTLLPTDIVYLEPPLP